jgi:serine phosphatase RsbU (regulator of sigma subunit)
MEIDFHKAITIKERSSRYIRTAFEFLERNKGPEVFEQFLQSIGLERESSVYKHITDDDNWNSYALELFITEQLSDLFDDPFQAAWDFGVASGSGKFDQKSSLFTVKTKLAPPETILRKISERTTEVSLISTCHAERIKPKPGSPYPRNARITFDYNLLPEGFAYPHWTSIQVGAGIVFGVMRFRKGLDCILHITHWPNLPSDFPNWRGERYIYDKDTSNIILERTGAVIANSQEGPFELGGVVFNNGSQAHFEIEWKPESLFKAVGDMTILRRRRRRQEEQAAYRQKLTNEMTREHQAQLSRYEKELSEKTRIIEQQKIQQDGDYFLTSLLTNPINRNSNSSPHIKTDFVLEQKKKFSFRNREGQLGGDLCITDTIELMGRTYTVLFNGDAMGKSLQGAGGMLVMGALFLSHLNRSKISVSHNHRGPENFIEQMYTEMQHLFLIFNGSMSMSIFLGLVDDSSGMLYYLNCEHPWGVLLRDGKAAFIEHELKARKIGYEMPGDVSVDRIQLQKGDVLFVGSDGRDDLAIDNRNGIRIINEDEYEFVRKVEKSKGDMDILVDSIRDHGEVTDDLSLIRIEVNSLRPASEVPPPAKKKTPETASDLTSGGESAESIEFLIPLTEYEKNEHYKAAVHHLESGNRTRALDEFEQMLDDMGSVEPVLRRVAQLYFQEKDYRGVIRTVEEWESLPDSSISESMLYLLSCACKMERMFVKAADLAEQIRKMNPGNINNLINLIDCYRHLRKYNKALQVCDDALELKPGQRLVLQLQAAIERHVQ